MTSDAPVLDLVDVANAVSSERDSTDLYRHFSADGELLYVGISLSAVVRLAGHRNTSHWFRQIASVTVEKFATRQEAERAERLAIEREKPRHNLARVNVADSERRKAAEREKRQRRTIGKERVNDADADYVRGLFEKAAIERGLETRADVRVTEDGASDLLGLSVATVRNWRSIGWGPAYYVGEQGRIFYWLRDLAVFIESCKGPSREK